MNETGTAAPSGQGRLQRVAWMFHRDFLCGNRIDDLDALLRAMHAQQYRLVSVAEWADLVTRPRSAGTRRNVDHGMRRLIVLRHDVDTDPGFARVFGERVGAVGGQASFFFRRQTWNDGIIAKLVEQGHHVGYHYEELADWAKSRRTLNPATVRAALPAIQARFAANLAQLRSRSGLPLDIVCSHGDWVNRRLGLRNTLLLDSPPFRAEVGVRFENYDETLLAPLAGHFSDSALPRGWQPAGLDYLLAQGAGPLHLLTHPRNWRSRLVINLRQHAQRLHEAVRLHGQG